MKEILRLFIAINFSEDIKNALFDLTSELKRNKLKGNLTHRENFHLTLAFLGETSYIEDAGKVLDNISNKSFLTPFYLYTEGAFRFKRREGDIFCVGIRENPSLQLLYNEIKKELERFEFYAEEKEFKPHLTLGRGIILRTDYEFENFKRKVPSLCQKIDEINLMKSHRVDGKLTYTKIYSVRLTEET
ncbi:RNA 2',3'-cyclic phosphodiesterase [Anaerocolumna cellulosilytica]|uniref:RNA 2',3'-cyclic phosphodiesterase n=1 Tax=Anaerocolumna cellulosilytica TaxID=433286 RepID=A0A6S6R3F9_9FIRM|nr:RNA 2',3'-cyclic phosphodiesterase [Anaerocolumna cellulosilytica]MBB5195356.1 2'-5' RNA ligase [Anaerocolumna cellulosilytica]BCJ95889.1 RNA 2',3'-cyclic phosphodiesterase [Anaerocolumna cellulosilytica]